jgi:hypothetical protein
MFQAETGWLGEEEADEEVKLVTALVVGKEEVEKEGEEKCGVAVLECCAHAKFVGGECLRS